MSPKLPVISGADLIRALGKLATSPCAKRAATSAFATQPTLSVSPSQFPSTPKLPPVPFAAFFATLRSLLRNSSRYSSRF